MTIRDTFRSIFRSSARTIDLNLLDVSTNVFAVAELGLEIVPASPIRGTYWWKSKQLSKKHLWWPPRYQGQQVLRMILRSECHPWQQVSWTTPARESHTCSTPASDPYVGLEPCPRPFFHRCSGSILASDPFSSMLCFIDLCRLANKGICLYIVELASCNTLIPESLPFFPLPQSLSGEIQLKEPVA